VTRPRSSKILASLAALGLVLCLVATNGSSFAQQPPSGDKDPSRLPLGDVQPGGRPNPQAGQPGQPPPGGQAMPGQRPAFPPPQRPQPQRPQPQRINPERAAAQREPEEKSHGAEHCPGHGPLDDPHGINWWQGLIGVNNDAVRFDEKKDEHGHVHRIDPFISQLLWRYENPKNECDEKNQPPPFLASLLNFGLLAFLVYRFGKKPLAEALASRKQAMMREIANAEHLKEEAERRLAEYEDKLQKLDETLEQMKKDYVAQSEAERAHVLAEAQERRARMKRDVEFRLEQEMKAAKAQLLNEAVEGAVAAAEALLHKKVGQADLDRTGDEYIAGFAAAWKGDALKARDVVGGAA
jgi:F-type H+-transporting ATPase subunit b